jgi:hypothetical protein
METYQLKSDLQVFGVKVNSFPSGVGEAFDRLVNMVPDGFSRSYFGISYMENGQVVYKATAEQKEEDEAERYNCEKATIEKGKYFISVLKDWRTKTDCIKDIFMEMMEEPGVHLGKPCIEWYLNDNEMWCMMKVKE